LRARFERQVQDRRAAITQCLTRHGIPPLFLASPFDPDVVSAYFHTPGRDAAAAGGVRAK
jgi:hypothetical protein